MTTHLCTLSSSFAHPSSFTFHTFFLSFYFHFSCVQNLPMLIAPSSAPLNPSHQVINSQSFSISWHAPLAEDQNGDIQYYLIDFTEVDTNVTSQVFSTNTSITLTGLHPYYTYVYSISAYTVGEGPYTSENSVILPEDGKLKLYILSLSLSLLPSLSLSFSFPLPFSLPCYLPTSILPLSLFLLLLLSLSFLYQIDVTRCFLLVAPSAAPVNPSGDASDSRTIVLTWNPPPLEYQNGIIREYKILIVELETMSTFTIVSSSLTATIQSLHPNYNYRCSVTAVTIAEGPYTQVFTVTTPEDSKFK